MRVLLLSQLYRGGGAERCARELHEALPTLGISAEMWTAARRAGDPPTARSLRWRGERYLFPLDWLRGPNDWRHFGSRWNLARVELSAFDLVHLHNAHGNWLSLASLRRLAERVPLVWTLHDEWVPSGGLVADLSRTVGLEEAVALSARSSRLMPYHATPMIGRLRRLLARELPRPAAVICPSRYLTELVRASGRLPVDAIHQVRNGVSLLDEPAIDMPRDEARRRFGLSSQAPVVLLIANDVAVAHKGTDLGLAALRQLRSPRPQLLVLGRGRIGVDALPRDVTVRTGWAGDPETLAAAYRAADLTLVPSRAENFPFVATESLACATPVVAFAVGGLPEIIGADERGLLVPVFDVDALAAGCARLLDDAALRARLGEAGRSWVREHCDMREYLARIVEIYAGVARASAR